MNDRVQLALDGDVVARRALTEEEQTEFRAARAMIGHVLRQLPAKPGADISGSVMEQLVSSSPVRGKADTKGRGLLNWLLTPRPFSMQWRPAYAVALALLIGVFAAIRGMTPTPATIEPAQVLVEFRLDAPNAHQVQLAGNFSDWKPVHTLKRAGSGTWTVVVPMTPGVHSYGFVIDGERWVPDPMAPAVADGFGGVNSQIAVLSPDQARSL
ncbi:MAG TPA: glycogen-binding domain-containing protein [Longimicrobiales bacterium]